MIKYIYSVRDVKTGYGPLMLFDNDAVAMRAFAVSVGQTDSLMHWCPADYQLFCVGAFDDTTGALHTDPDMPRHVCDAVDFVVKDGDVK